MDTTFLSSITSISNPDLESEQIHHQTLSISTNTECMNTNQSRFIIDSVSPITIDTPTFQPERRIVKEDWPEKQKDREVILGTAEEGHDLTRVNITESINTIQSIITSNPSLEVSSTINNPTTLANQTPISQPSNFFTFTSNSKPNLLASFTVLKRQYAEFINEHKAYAIAISSKFEEKKLLEKEILVLKV